MLSEFDELRLTAFALREGAPEDQAEVEALLRLDPAAREHVEEIRATAGLFSAELEKELAPGLSDEQHLELDRRWSIRDRERYLPAARRAERWNYAILGFSVAASIFIVAGTLAVLVPLLYRRFEVRNDAVAQQSTPYVHQDNRPATPSLPPADGMAASIRSPGDPGPGNADNTEPLSPRDHSFSAPFPNAQLARNGIDDADQRLVGTGSGTGFNDLPVIAPRLVHGALAISGPRDATDDATHKHAADAGPKADWFSAYLTPLPSAARPAAHVLASASPEPDAELDDHFADSPFVRTADQPQSLFAANVGSASFINVRRSLNRGRLPLPDAVRVEEMLNYFSWKSPAAGPVSADGIFCGEVETSVCPWNPTHRLARVLLKARELSPQARPPVNLVFLIDVSRSMAGEDKLPLIQKGMKRFISQLTRRDRVCIVAAPQPEGFLLPPTSGDDHIPIIGAIERLKSGGSMAAGSGLETAYYAARSSFVAGGINRVVLISDGNWLAGVTDPAGLTAQIASGAKDGVSLGVIAVGPKRLNDRALRHLADAGDGTLSLVDSVADAQRELFGQANGALVQAAHDVRLSVRLDPAAAESYRLIGYESHRLSHVGSHDEASGGEIGAGRAMMALYELVPTAKADAVSPLSVHVLYKAPGREEDRAFDLAAPAQPTAWSKVSNDYLFAAAVTEFSLLLRQSDAGTATYATAQQLAQQGRGPDDTGARQEFLDLLKKARSLADQN